MFITSTFNDNTVA